LAGKYRVERVLGVGGMGVVVAARHVQLDVPVALKFMTEQSLTNYDLVNRFLREARATARLRGEHVVRVSDVGTLDSGAPYMVMEYLQGLDLAALLTKLGPPPIEHAVEYVIQACEGLAEAHRAGFVHRDVKPSNLFLIQRPNGTSSIKVLDFGISKAIAMAGQEVPLATSTHAIFGSPLYMAPEQMRAARDVDARADVWSIGASLYELLSGSVPFAAQTVLDLAYRIANEDPPPLSARRSEVSRGLESIVLRCLAKNRDRRFADASAVAEALSEFRPRQSSRDEKAPLQERRDGRIVDTQSAASQDPTSSDELETKILPSPGPGALRAQRVVVVNENPRAADEATLRSRGIEERPSSSAVATSAIVPDTDPLATVPFNADPSRVAPAIEATDLKASTLSWGQSQRLSSRRRRPLLYGLLLVGSVSAVSAFVFYSRSREDPAPSSPIVRASAPVVTESSPPAEVPRAAPRPSVAAPTIAVTDLPQTAPAPTPAALAAARPAAPSRPRPTEPPDGGRRVSSIGGASASGAAVRPNAEKVDPLAP
jgi:serine/threonine-protein kinase